MATLREYFVTESNDLLARIDDALNQLDAARGDPSELLRLTRGLRGSAHLAREARVFRAGLGLEVAARALGSGRLNWSADVSGRIRRTVQDVYTLMHGGEPADEADARVHRVLERWREFASERAAATPDQAGAVQSAAGRQFREFATQEVDGIAAEIDSSIGLLGQDPRNHDAIKALVRRQRALLGAARLSEIGAVHEVLNAVEDLARLILKLNVAVKDDWFAALRAARDALHDALGSLRRGEDPGRIAALVRLRSLRSSLIERYGEGENGTAAAPADSRVVATIGASGVSAMTSGPVGPSSAGAVKHGTPVRVPVGRATTILQMAGIPADSAILHQEAAIPADSTIFPIESLCYSAEHALRRALELRTELESLAQGNAAARERVDELFDLIRLGIG